MPEKRQGPRRMDATHQTDVGCGSVHRTSFSAVLLAERLGRDRCRIGQQATTAPDYLEFNRPPTPGPAAELLAEVRRWLAEERITQTIVWIRVCSRLPYRVNVATPAHDGLRVSARLYLPSPELGYEGPRPLVYYIHGGPQGQERPNFAWFSMPLIQILALEGFAVFVPNVRGSTGLRARVLAARRSRLGRPGPSRPRLRDAGGAAQGRPRRRHARGRDRPLVRRLHDADAGGPSSGAVERRSRHVRAVRPTARSCSASPRPGSRSSRSRSATRSATATSSSSVLRTPTSRTSPARCS